MVPSPYFFIIRICLVDTNVIAKCDEIPSMTPQGLKETKCHGRTDGQSVKAVYPPTTQFAGV